MRKLSAVVVAISFVAAPPAAAQWSSDPAINLAIADFAVDQREPRIAASGDGSTWIGWFDRRAGVSLPYALYVQRLDAQGVESFPHGGLLVSPLPIDPAFFTWSLISDGAGGCVLAFTSEQVFAHRIAANGAQLWGANGIPVSTSSELEVDLALARMSDGNFVAVWSSHPLTFGPPTTIRAQKLDPSGARLFGPAGLYVGGIGSEVPMYPGVVPSHAGAFIVSWNRDASENTSPSHLLSMKFDSLGFALWNGAAPLSIFDAGSLPAFETPRLESDGNGGAVYGWRHEAGIGTSTVSVQRVDAAGAEIFPHDGVSVCNDPNVVEFDPALAVLSGSGDVIVAFTKRDSFQTKWGLSVQRVSNAGARLWGSTGLDLNSVDFQQKSFLNCLAFGDGALVFSQHQAAPFSTNFNVQGFRLDGAGLPVWTPAALAVSTAASPKQGLVAALDSSGVARLAWGDSRTDVSDLYAQNVNPDATLGNSGTCGTVGYCTTSPNSAGAGALIASTGSTSLGLNDFTLRCTGLPAPSSGMFVYGSTPDSTPFGNGTRCVGGTIVRLDPPQASQAGVATRAFDFTQPPGSGGAGQIFPGSTWYFQYWYRDKPAGGALFNVSDGLQASFCP